MVRQMDSETRSGPRYLVSFEVRAEWDEPGGSHVVAEGTTENVGPEGTLVHLPQKLPAVGSQALVHAVGAARVSSRRAQTRCLPRYGLCTRMKDEGCEHKVETFFARLAMVLKPEKESTVKR